MSEYKNGYNSAMKTAGIKPHLWPGSPFRIPDNIDKLLNKRESEAGQILMSRVDAYRSKGDNERAQRFLNRVDELVGPEAAKDLARGVTTSTVGIGVPAAAYHGLRDKESSAYREGHDQIVKTARILRAIRTVGNALSSDVPK